MKKILIIEDDFFIQDIYTRAFTQAGYTVDSATNGQEGVDKGKTTTYDFILLDILLPLLTGLEVLPNLRAQDSQSKMTPIFIVTNLGQEDVIKEAFSNGADGYLIKSQMTPKSVITEVNAYLTNKKPSESSE